MLCLVMNSPENMKSQIFSHGNLLEIPNTLKSSNIHKTNLINYFFFSQCIKPSQIKSRLFI